MAEQERKAVTRTITVSDLTPQELASIFAQMNDHQQAQFFNAVADEAKGWPGSGWEMQACSICNSAALLDKGRDVIRALASFVDDQ